MTLSDLESLARELRDLLSTASASVDSFATKLEAARAHPDPFASLYFAARKSYRHACATATKSGAAIERDSSPLTIKQWNSASKAAFGIGRSCLRICLR